MPDNATLNQALQIGMQSVFNTPVPATKVMKSFGIDLGPHIETDTYFPNGNIFPTSSGLIQEWTEGDLSGVLTYTEVVYPLSALLGPATITTPGGATTAKEWEWAPAANAVLNPVLMTVEKGSSVYAVNVPDALLTGFNIGWSRTDRIEIGGSVMGKRLTKGATLTAIGANPTVEIVRVMPPQIDVFYDASYAGLGTTKQLRAFSAGISLDDLYGAVWPMNSALTGHDGYIPQQPSSESTMQLMADAAGLAFLDSVRAGDTGYLRIKATGPIIEAAIAYEFTVDMAVQVSDVGTFEDSNGVYAIPWTFQPVDDGTNPPLAIRVVNTLAAL
jgi:hypothetical protein